MATSSEPYADIMMMVEWTPRRRISSISSSPPRPGMRMSERITSKLRRSSSDSACAAEPTAATALAGLALGSCNSPPLETPNTQVKQQTPIRVAQNLKNKVDVLFLIDNSNSMDAMQAELRMKFFQFFKVFSDLASQGTLAD